MFQTPLNVNACSHTVLYWHDQTKIKLTVPLLVNEVCDTYEVVLFIFRQTWQQRKELVSLRKQAFIPQSYFTSVHFLTNEAVIKGKYEINVRSLQPSSHGTS